MSLGGKRVVTPDGPGRVVGTGVHLSWDAPRLRERRQAYALVLLDSGRRRAYWTPLLELEREKETTDA